MLQGVRVVVRLRHPLVAEHHSGQVQAGLRRVHHARHAGERQVTAQNPMRSAAGQPCEELCAGHALTVSQRAAARERAN